MLGLVILSILFTWLLCAAVCIGIGALILRCLQQRFSLLDALWTGVALIAAILQLYHFARPIDLLIVYILFGLALAGWLWNSKSLLQRFNFQLANPQFGSRTHLRDFLFFSLAAVLIAFRAAGPCEHYDTGMYGAQAIRWFITYPLVPGLGNLLGQLGFNSSIFLWIAALDQGPWRDFAYHLFAGFLIAAFFASIIPAALRVFRGVPIFTATPPPFRESSISSVDWFFTLLFIPAAIIATTGKISGANTDLPTTVVCLVAAAMLFRALDERGPARNGGEENEARNSERESEPQNTDEDRRMSLIVAMLLFSLAVTFKISSAVFAFSGWILALLKLWPLSRRTPRRKWILAGAVILSAAVVLPWMCRGLILTGYPFFPSTALGISADWKVPAAAAQAQADFARSFARIPQIPLADTQGFHWLRPWFRELIREREGFLIPLFFALAGVIAVLIRIVRGKRAALPQWLWLLAPALAGLVFWFVEAPAIRFGEPILWTAGATLGTFAALHFLNGPGPRHAGKKTRRFCCIAFDNGLGRAPPSPLGFVLSSQPHGEDDAASSRGASYSAPNYTGLDDLRAGRFEPMLGCAIAVLALFQRHAAPAPGGRPEERLCIERAVSRGENSLAESKASRLCRAPSAAVVSRYHKIIFLLN
jgi:hypothetical protein